MTKDFVTELITQTIQDVIEEELEGVTTEEEATKILKRIEDMDMESIMVTMYSRMAKDTAQYMRDTMFEEVMGFRADEQEFLSRQDQKWYKAFVTSEAMYLMVLEASQSYSAYVHDKKQEELALHGNMFTAIKYIHGRAMQQFLEIITLMKNGFADGAYARWRSMYELTIIASFINKYGEAVAESFIEASGTSDRYEWARKSGIFSSKKRYISFSDLQKSCAIDVDIWEKQYNLANQIVHASPQGTFSRLGHMEGGDEVILVGRSDFGITTPAEHSAISLAHISTIFFTILSTGDSVVSAKYINSWIDIIREGYFKAHDEIFPDSESLWDAFNSTRDIDASHGESSVEGDEE